jgi:hypothetical protein
MMVKMMAVLGSAALAVSSAALALPAGVAASAPAPMEAGLLRTAPAPLFGSGTRNSTLLSSNWAGFVDGDSTTAGNQLTPGDATFDGVSGTWNVPTLVVPPGHGQEESKKKMKKWEKRKKRKKLEKGKNKDKKQLKKKEKKL